MKRFVPNRLKKAVKKILPKGKANPKICSLFMTDRCNFKCVGCRRSVLSVNEANEMKLSTVKKVLKIYPTIKTFSIAGFGEPSLCEEFVDIVEFLKGKDRKINIITNGTNLAKFKELKCDVDQISVSLYGYDIDSYFSYTRVDTYKRVIENFSLLKEKFNNVGLSYILTRNNFKDLEKIISLGDELEPDFLDLTNYLAYNFNVKKETERIITAKDEEIIDFINEISKEKDYIREKPVYIDFEKPKYACSSYRTRINLDGDGNIGGCMRQIPPDSSFGNIFKEKDPFNSPEMMELRKIQNTMKKTGRTPHKECNYCFGNWIS